MKQLRVFALLLAISIYYSSCRQKDKSETVAVFPALSFIKSQIAHVDSSFYRIIKIETLNNVSDSSYVKREDFSKLASDFVSLPDISEKKLSKLYTEERLFDQLLNRAVLVYTPIKEGQEILKMEIVITPGPAGDKVKNIIISTNQNENGKLVSKNLLWMVDESFQVVKIVLAEDKSEKITITKVIWNKNEE